MLVSQLELLERNARKRQQPSITFASRTSASIYIHQMNTNKAEDPNIYMEFAVPSSKFCALTYTADVQCVQKYLLQTHQLCMQ